MDNYTEILEKEKKLNSKESLLEDTIVKDKISQYEIISRMYAGLVKEIEELKGILFKDLSVTNESKEKAEKNFKNSLLSSILPRYGKWKKNSRRFELVVQIHKIYVKKNTR